MRKLLMMCGAPGCGKSTLAHLVSKRLDKTQTSVVTLSLDTFRQLFCPTHHTVDNEKTLLSGAYAKAYITAFETALMSHVQAGTTLIVDNTNIRLKNVRPIVELATKYGYDVAFAKFETDVTTLIERNDKRHGTDIVDPEALITMQARSSGIELPPVSHVFTIQANKKQKDKLKPIAKHIVNEFFVTPCELPVRSQHVAVFGDIHGCSTRLKAAIDALPEDTQMVFCGDLFDRGEDSLETLRIASRLAKTRDVTFVEGNHDSHIRRLYNDPEHVRETLFKQTRQTLAQIDEHEDAKELKRLMRRYVESLRLAVTFTTNGRQYIVTHGGLNASCAKKIARTKQIPPDMTANDFIYGCCTRHECYNKANPSDYTMDAMNSITGFEHIVQIHGHRNRMPDATITRSEITGRATVYNLESKVESPDGCLSVLLIDTVSGQETLKTFQ